MALTTVPPPAAAPANDAVATTAHPATLRLGGSVMVKVAPGSMLRNNESGGFFTPDVPTPQTVTVTLLRRLQDGDLVLC